MSADEAGRTGAVAVTARPGVSAPVGDEPANGAVPGAPGGEAASHSVGCGLRAARDPGPVAGGRRACEPAPGAGGRRVRATVPPSGTAHAPTRRPAQLLAGVAWAVLLLGLWLWGRDLADGVAAQLATTGDVAAAGRPLGRQAPPHAHAPVPAAATTRPVRITIDALGLRGAALTERGLDGDGLLTAPPYTSPAPVGWYAEGPQPGEAGAALLVARAGDDRAAADRGPGARRAVFRHLTRLRPGQQVVIQRADGSTARFTVEDVQMHDRHRFDPRKAYAAHDRGRPELRLIADDSGADADRRPRQHGTDGGNVIVVSAYLTAYQEPTHRRGAD
ncbi:sortase domain-bontaining protein [Streptomyces sp. NPDC058773]|uniref:sortase domain-containing protein n=1 Tax=Streptomyces sp. NPDC058773 TaxID=3346632 RepID=UPI003699AA91